MRCSFCVIPPSQPFHSSLYLLDARTGDVFSTAAGPAFWPAGFDGQTSRSRLIRSRLTARVVDVRLPDVVVVTTEAVAGAHGGGTRIELRGREHRVQLVRRPTRRGRVFARAVVCRPICRKVELSNAPLLGSAIRSNVHCTSSKESLAADGTIAKPIGMGPFEFVNWTPGSAIDVKSAASHWRTGADGKPLPYLDTVTANVGRRSAEREPVSP